MWQRVCRYIWIKWWRKSSKLKNWDWKRENVSERMRITADTIPFVQPFRKICATTVKRPYTTKKKLIRLTQNEYPNVYWPNTDTFENTNMHELFECRNVCVAPYTIIKLTHINIAKCHTVKSTTMNVFVWICACVCTRYFHSRNISFSSRYPPMLCHTYDIMP